MFGPLELTLAHRSVGARELGGIKPRQLLEVLLLERGRPVPKDRIADCLWGERLPVSTAATIETYVSQLRRIVGRQVIRTEAGGYRIPAGSVTTDVDEFDALVQRAAAATGSGAAPPCGPHSTSPPASCWPTSPTPHGCSGHASSCQASTTTRGSATSNRSWPPSGSSCRPALRPGSSPGTRSG
jgi:hypothetical protein